MHPVDIPEDTQDIMDSQRWQQIQKIFDHIVDKTPSHRRDYLAMVCDQDETLQQDVESLLNANDEATQKAWLPSAQMPQETPDIPGYKIIGELGRGAMGIVYHAQDDQARDVALKILPSYLIHDNNARQRFIQEANALQAVNHHAICQVYEVFTGDAQEPCIAMQLCNGITLQQTLEEGPLAYKHSMQIIADIAAGLSEAHRQNIYHRDIKPANIIISEEGQGILIDFGIAKFADTRLTATGIVIGSPKYMSPEQWRGRAIDQQTDLWSLGVVLHEMIAGTHPFQRDNKQDLARAIFNESAPPLPALSCDGLATDALQKIVYKLLEKEQVSRYESTHALIDDLLAIT